MTPGVEEPDPTRATLAGLVTFSGPIPPPERGSAMADLPSWVGGYRIDGELGRGGLGVVLRGYDPDLKRAVAVKMILAGAFAGPETRARFRTEAEATARLNHPSIVRVYEVGEDLGRPFLVLELIDGPTLAKRLAAAPLKPVEAARLVHVLAGAVSHAHEAGIIHRDLKPANVLTLADGTPKVADFGLAKELSGNSDLTGTGAVLGTPSYMAPEQSSGGEVGPAADIWALGAILYECLTGRSPFLAASVLETLERVRTIDPVSPRALQPGVPRDLETIALKCLRKPPGNRYASAAALVDDLGRFLEGRPILARPVGPVVRLGKWCRRNKALAALVVVSALAVAGGVAGGTWYNLKLQRAVETISAKEAEVRQEKDRADANYRSARDTIRRIVGQTHDRAFQGTPRLRELERKQAEEAIRFYQGVAAQPGQTPEVRQDVAAARIELGRYLTLFNRTDEALAHWSLAAENFASLRAEFPDEEYYAEGRAHAQTLLAMYRPTPDEAEYRGSLARVEEAIALRTALLAARPDDPNRCEALAMSENCRATLAYNRKESETAEAHFLASLAHYEAAARLAPGNRDYQRAIAAAHVNLSVFYQNQAARHPDAKRTHDRAEAVLNQLLDADPNDDDSRRHRNILRLNWAYALEKHGERDRGIADLEANIRELEPIHRREPDHAQFKSDLRRSYSLRAELLRHAGRHAESAASWRSALACAETPGDKTYTRLELGMALARAGDSAAAMAEGRGVAAELPGDSPWTHFLHLAHTAAIARSQLLKANPGATALADEYAEWAVEMLARSKAVAKPPDWARRVPEFLSDPDMRPVVTRPGVPQRLWGK